MTDRSATRNEAAERLLAHLSVASTTNSEYIAWRERLDAALDRERRLTVERIRERLDRRRWESDMDASWVHDVLDEAAP